MKKILILTTTLTLILITNSYAGDWVVTRLTNNSYADSRPAINNNGHIVWSSYCGTNGTSELFYYDGTTMTRITDDEAGDGNASINDSGWVAWAQTTKTPTETYQIYLYDGINIINISNSTKYEQHPRINNSGYVSWDNATDGVNYYNGSTAQNIGGSLSYYGPIINNSGYITWGTGSIYLYNGSSVEIIGSGSNPKMNDRNQIAYDDGNNVWLYDNTNNISIATVGRQVDSICINNNGYVAWTAYGQGVSIYDGHSIKKVGEIDGDYLEMNSNNILTWTSNGQLFVYDGIKTIQLEAPRSYCPKINDQNTIVWYAGDNNAQSEIYMATFEGSLPPNEAPVADAGADMTADANESVTLDASASYDTDGTINNYTWKRLPDDVVLYSGGDSVFSTKALGRVEEVIELTVRDNRGDTAADTLSIMNKKISDYEDKVAQIDRQINPSLEIISPVEGSSVNGVVSFSISSNNSGSINYCFLQVDGKNLGYLTTAPFSFNWDSRYWDNGEHTIKVTAYFRSSICASKSDSITVITDNSPVLTPTIKITVPAADSTVSGTINIATDARSDEYMCIYMYVDNVYKTCDNSAPFAFIFNTATLSNGIHSIKLGGYFRLTGQFITNNINVNVSN